jgi:hypothetical protein
MDLCLLCLYVVLSCVGRGLCNGLITGPEESYRVSNCICDHRNPERGPMFQVGNDRKMNEWMNNIHTDRQHSGKSSLGGLVADVLASGPKGRGFKPGRGDWFFMVIKIHRIPSFGWEVKPEFPCRKILRHVKEPCVALELRWGCTIRQKMATVLGTLRSTPPSNSNQ